MFQHQMRFSLLAVLAACMLALAGCGGSSTTTTTAPEVPEPVEVTVDLRSVAADAMREADTVEIAAGETGAIGEIAFMCPAGGLACTVTVTLAEDGTASAMSTGGAATASDSAAYTMRKADEMSAEEVAKTKSAATKVTAIRMEAAETAEEDRDRGLGGNAVDPAEAGQVYTLTIKRDNMGTTVEIGDPMMAEDDDPEFMMMADMGEAGGFAGSMHVRDNGDGEEEVVVVRTDIAEPKPTDFADEYMLNAGEDVISLRMTNDNVGMLKSAAITASGAGMLTFPRPVEDDVDTDMDETVEGFVAPATFDGAAGMIACRGENNDCGITIDEDGKFIAVTTTAWHFTPAEDEQVDVADDSYLAYGFWLKTITKDGATTYDEVETFTRATGVVETGDGSGPEQIGSVTGTATYNGNATGVYVKNVLDNQANVLTATSGHFSADVVLNASFGGGNIAVNNQFAIDGTVTNFNLAHGETNDWAVMLNAADFSGRTGMGPGKGAAGNTHVNEFSGTATGDSTAAAGSWNGAFYGDAGGEVDHDGDGATAAINVHPSSVLGEFNANFTDGTTAGAFGANK